MRRGGRHSARRATSRRPWPTCARRCACSRATSSAATRWNWPGGGRAEGRTILRKGTGLVDLVEAARGRALAGDRIARWHVEERQWDHGRAVRAQNAAAEIAEEACRLCLGGQFRHACDIAYPYDLYVAEKLWSSLQWLDECPHWAEFSEAVQLAERIDSFLAVLEGDRLGRGLAQDCRADLDLLGVLADWCQDNALPQAAAEARHLHELAGSLPRGVPHPGSSGRDYDETYEGEME
jgi:hypothetical protein